MWIGFFINIGYVMVPIDVGELATTMQITLESPEAEAEIRYMANVMRLGFLIFQALGIAAFFIRPKAGLVISLCASVPTFLNSCIYIFGALFTYYRFMYDEFSFAPTGGDQIEANFANWRSMRMLKNSFLLFAGSMLIMVFLPSPLTVLVFILCIVGAIGMLIVGIRLRLMPAMTFFSSGVGILPHILATPVYLPYATIRSASLLAGGTIQFQVELDDGIHTLTVSLQNIHPEERKAAVAKLANALQQHDIQVY